MKKITLSSTTILKHKFSTELAGYNAKEVDLFLDQILNDYISYDENIKELEKHIEISKSIISEKQKLLEKNKLELETLKEQMHKISNSGKK